MLVISRTCSEWNKGQNLLYLSEFLQVSAFFRVQRSSEIQTSPSPNTPCSPIHHQNLGVRPPKPKLVLVIKTLLCL